MSDLAGIIEIAIDEARKQQARKAQALRLKGLPPGPAGRPPAQSAVRPAAPAPRPAPKAADSPFTVPGAPPLDAVAPPPVPLLLPFRDRSVLLASIVLSEALAPPLGLQPRKLPSQ